MTMNVFSSAPSEAWLFFLVHWPSWFLLVILLPKVTPRKVGDSARDRVCPLMFLLARLKIVYAVFLALSLTSHYFVHASIL